MRTFILKRILHTIPLLLGVSLLAFIIIHIAPGDYLSLQLENPNVRPESVERMRHAFGLDRPWYLQYFYYIRQIFLHLDFGESFPRHQPVFTAIKGGFGNTLLLASAAAVITWGLALPLGIIAAVKQNTWVDRLAGLVAFVGLSTPEVLAGLGAIIFAARTHWFPINGIHSIDYDTYSAVGKVVDVLYHLILPALVLGSITMASRMRQMRGNLLEVLRADYVTTARAKGLSESVVIRRHAVRNAINPIITLFGYTLGSLVAGSFIVEIVFGWPGLGMLTLDAYNTHDTWLVMGSLLMGSSVLILGNLVADLLLVLADPRISYN